MGARKSKRSLRNVSGLLFFLSEGFFFLIRWTFNGKSRKNSFGDITERFDSASFNQQFATRAFSVHSDF